jgi:hypothetical protein
VQEPAEAGMQLLVSRKALVNSLREPAMTPRCLLASGRADR